MSSIKRLAVTELGDKWWIPPVPGHYLAKWIEAVAPQAWTGGQKYVVVKYNGSGSSDVSTPADGSWKFDYFEWFQGPLGREAFTESATEPVALAKPEVSLPSWSAISPQVEKVLEENKELLEQFILKEVKKGNRYFDYKPTSPSLIEPLVKWVNSQKGYWAIRTGYSRAKWKMQIHVRKPWQWPKIFRLFSKG